MDDTAGSIRSLFEQYADDVYRYARYSLPPDVDAKDVVQEVFLRAFRGWGDFKGDSDPKTWLFKIARNFIFDQLRKKRRQRLCEAEISNEFRPAQLDTIIELEDALQRLSLPHRHILNLRWIQGMSVPETAEILGWSESKVRVTFHRAKRRLKEVLQDLPDNMLVTNSHGGDTAHGE